MNPDVELNEFTSFRQKVRSGLWLLVLAPFLMAVGLLLGGRGLASPTFQAASCPDPGAVIQDQTGAMAHVRYLADDALRGREVATPEARCAGDYLAEQFRAAGLEPGAPGGSWFQSFQIRGGTEMGPDNRLRTSAGSYTAGETWIPLGFSRPDSVSAPTMYAGHGISRPGDPDDEYFHRDVSGKVVVVESGDPSSPSGRSVHSDPHFKATLANGRGAAGLVVLLPGGEDLPDISGEVRGGIGIPVAAVRGAAADRIRALAQNGDSLTLRTDVTPRMVEARNVVALLPGTDPDLSDEWIVLGAHYDHLGMGGEGSLAPDQRSVHNGADDNASGTAAMVEVARRLAREGGLDRSVLFIAFTGEEKGLWGSAHYVREPLHPLESTVAMLNLDMVGRLDGRALTVFGFGTAEEWGPVVEFANQSLARPLEIARVDDGFGPSDHSSFYARGVPVLHFFSNTHSDYHRPTDDWQKIDADGLERITALVTEVTRKLAGTDRMAATDLTPSPTDANPHAGGISDPGDRDDADAPERSYGPYVGTIPDFSPAEGGLRLTGVREGSPAEEAGLQGGDVMVEFAGREITDIYTYTYALQDHQPGDTVQIVVERNGERVTVTAVLGQRE